MKIVFYILTAVLIWGIQNVILELKMSKYTVFTVLIFVNGTGLAFSIAGLLWMLHTGQPIEAPAGKMIALALLVGILFFFGDFFYFMGYRLGGSVATVTMLLCVLPVVASVVKYLWTGGVPNRYQVAAYCFAVIAVLFAAKGAEVQK